jgi:hypothetical protein
MCGSPPLANRDDNGPRAEYGYANHTSLMRINEVYGNV